MILLVYGTRVAASANQTQPLPASLFKQELLGKLVTAATERTDNSVRYGGTCPHIRYPGGEGPPGIGASALGQEIARRIESRCQGSCPC
jgi:hypothetical protein